MILQHFSFEWLGINGASIPLNSPSYVIVDYNAGTPIVSIVVVILLIIECHLFLDM
jgi:hypothetical protein